MKFLRLPHVGYRNLKTALAVFICLLFLDKSLMASIAAIICMQSTIEDSVVTGINRLVGTLLGGLLGIIIIYFISLFNLQDYSIFISALSVSLVIYICNLIKKPAACVIAAIVVLGIVIDQSIDNQIFYALDRTLETSLGVVIAILINRFINPPADSDLNLLDLNKENTNTELDSLKTTEQIETNLDTSNVIEEGEKDLSSSIIDKKYHIKPTHKSEDNSIEHDIELTPKSEVNNIEHDIELTLKSEVNNIEHDIELTPKSEVNNIKDDIDPAINSKNYYEYIKDSKS